MIKKILEKIFSVASILRKGLDMRYKIALQFWRTPNGQRTLFWPYEHYVLTIFDEMYKMERK